MIWVIFFIGSKLTPKGKPRKVAVYDTWEKESIWNTIWNLRYNLKVLSVTIKQSDEVELPGITIDKALNFTNHIENLCCTAQCKLHALRWIRKYVTKGKAKLLGNALTESQFDYASLIWMFSHKTTYLKMQRTPKVIYQSATSYDDLLQLSNSVPIQQWHLRFLLTEICKSTGTLNSQFMRSYFKYRGSI